MAELRLIVNLPVEKLKSDLFEKQRWAFSDLGYSNAEVISNQNTVIFSKFSLHWLEMLTKETVWRKRNSVTFQTQVCYVSTLRHLDRFLVEHKGDEFELEQLKRSVIEEYLQHISSRNANTRIRYIANLNEVFHCWYEWGFIDERGLRLIHRDDRPRLIRGRKPKFLNTKNQTELLDAVANPDANSSRFPVTLYRIMSVLQEVGMRGNEVLGLKKDCLTSDTHGDWYISRLNLKNRKIHTVPISNDLCRIIKDQIHETNLLEARLKKLNIENEGGHLFVHQWGVKIRPYTLRRLNEFLQDLGNQIELKDDFGFKRPISSHVFRHTVGTNLINNGMSQLFVQRFLGHDSPHMTAVYATIHDTTLRKELLKANSRMVDIKGNLYEHNEILTELEVETASLDAQWLKRHISTQCLPNGLCTLPIKQNCPHANACLTCPSFRTDETFLSLHKEQLARCEDIVSASNSLNYVRQAELNKTVAENLRVIIKALEPNE